MKKEPKLDQKFLKGERTRFKKKKLVAWAMILMVLVGAGLVVVGVVKNTTSSLSKIVIRDEKDLEKEIKSLEAEVDNLRKLRIEEYNSSAMSEKYHQIGRELVEKEGRQLNLSEELWRVRTGFYNRIKQELAAITLPWVMAGVFLIVGAGLAGRLAFGRWNFSKVLSGEFSKK